jgi:hypothetical protein
MADRFLVSEVQQVGVESSPGSAATPTIQLNGLNFDIDTDLEVDEFGPSGMLPMTIVAPRQEWSSGSLSGYPTYTELPYVFSNVLGAAIVTTPSGATDTRQWVWEPDESTPWTPKTLTLRRGVQGGTAEEANYLLMSGLGLTFSRTAAPELSGDLFAQRLNYAATLAATGVSSHELVPILPSQCDVYLDSASGSLGSTKLLRDFEFSWSISDLFDMIWPINSALPSFAAHSVQKPTIEAMLRLGNDAVGTGLVTNMRAGSTVWVRFHAEGAANSIESGHEYELTIDVPLKVFSAPSRADENGLSTLEWTFRNVFDPTWGKWVSITMMTDFATLGTP